MGGSMLLDRVPPRNQGRTGQDPLPCVVIKLGRLVERRLQMELAGCGITAAHLIALIEIARHPGISRADLARELRITPQAAGGISRQLINDELITRTPHVPGQSTAFTLTNAGAVRLREAVDSVRSVHMELLGTLAGTHAQAADATLRQLLHAHPLEAEATD